MHDTGKESGRAYRWAVLVAIVLIAACSRTPPEEKLRTTIVGLQSAVEQRDLSVLGDVIADDFIGPAGMDRDGARRMAAATFLRQRDVGVTLGPLDIDLRGEHATVRFTAVLTGGSGMLPDSGQVYDVDTGWRMEGDEWRLVNAGWKPRL